MRGQFPTANVFGGRRSPGFTLVEILIVVIILGIIAAIAIPQFSNAAHEAREATLKDDLRFLRMEVAVYKAQHRETSPGYAGGNSTGSASESVMIAQLTKFTDDNGVTSDTASPTFRFGPYLTRMPINPMSAESSIYIVGDGDSMPTTSQLPVGGASPYGWIYKPSTQEIMANLDGTDSTGVAYANY